MQAKLNLPWSMWDDRIIAAQMKRLNIKEIFSNDKDFEKVPWIKRDSEFSSSRTADRKL